MVPRIRGAKLTHAEEVQERQDFVRISCLAGGRCRS